MSNFNIRAGTKRSVISFNHISTDIVTKRIEELKHIYSYYHKQAMCLKWQYKKFKRLRLVLNMSSIGLTISGAIAGGVTLNPIILGAVSGAGVVIQGYIAKSNLNDKVREYKFAYTSYDKVLIQLRSYLRGMPYDEVVFLSDVKVLDDIIADFGLSIGKMSRKYQKRYENLNVEDRLQEDRRVDQSFQALSLTSVASTRSLRSIDEVEPISVTGV